ncbi:hypothetical protein VTK56DRAFT_2932 [Thermocarpiscus australiensis]
MKLGVSLCSRAVACTATPHRHGPGSLSYHDNKAGSKSPSVIVRLPIHVLLLLRGLGARWASLGGDLAVGGLLWVLGGVWNVVRHFEGCSPGKCRGTRRNVMVERMADERWVKIANFETVRRREKISALAIPRGQWAFIRRMRELRWLALRHAGRTTPLRLCNGAGRSSPSIKLPWLLQSPSSQPESVNGAHLSRTALFLELMPGCL